MACGCVNSRIFFSDCGSLLRPAKDPRKIFSRRGLAAPCGGRGNCPPKAVSEPPASVECKPFHFVSTSTLSKYLCAQIFIGTRCFLCTMTLVSIQRSTSPSNVQASNHLRSVSSWFRPQNRNCPFAVSSALENGKKILSSSVCYHWCQLWHRII